MHWMQRWMHGGVLASMHRRQDHTDVLREVMLTLKLLQVRMQVNARTESV